MEGERCGRQAEPVAELTGWQTGGAGLHEQAVDIEPDFLPKYCQGGQGIHLLHISSLMEM